MKTLIESLADGLSGGNVDVLLIGGHALAAYGVMRQTLDIDFLTAETSAAPFKNILLKAGFGETAGTENFSRLSHPSPLVMDVDILFVDRDTFRRMFEESKTFITGKIEIRVPSLPHLISLKLHAVKNDAERKNRDAGDIVELLKANPGKISSRELESLCLRHGPEGIFAELEKFL